MKILRIFASIVLIYCMHFSFAQEAESVQNQDVFPTEQVKTDTVFIEKVRVDTVYVKEQHPKEEPVEKVKEAPTNTNSKVYYGMYSNFSFGKYSIIGVEPLIGYKLFPKFSIGGKLSYEYFKNKNFSPKREGSNWGVGAFTRLRILRKLYAHVEFSEMNYKLFNEAGTSSNREWISFLYVGAGFSQPISKGISINAEVLWDVLQDDDSPYKTVEPTFNVGIGVGF